jgi:hypothetical protein
MTGAHFDPLQKKKDPPVLKSLKRSSNGSEVAGKAP